MKQQRKIYVTKRKLQEGISESSDCYHSCVSKDSFNQEVQSRICRKILIINMDKASHYELL